MRHVCELIFRILFLLLIPLTLFSQRTVSGRVTEAGSNEPIINASVFIANTTLGAITDTAGYYQLKIPEEGNITLTVSCVGYQPVIRDIAQGTNALTYDV